MTQPSDWSFRTESTGEAHDAWTRMLSTTHLPWNVTELLPEPGVGFGAAVRRRHLADLILVDCSCDPSHGVRGATQIGRTDGDYLVMLMTLQGREIVTQDGKQAVLAPGSVVVWDSETPAEFLVTESLVKRSLLVPKAALAEVGARGELLTGSVLDATAPAVTLLSGYLDALSSTIDRLPLSALPAARNATIELLAAALQEPARAPESTAATRTAAERFIEGNLRRHRLAATDVSRALGVSVRSLYRAFEDSGDSVSSFIRTRRLAHARDDLAAGMTVSQVARRWHYTDPSHFSRSFKRHFGVNPSDLTGVATGR